MMCTEIVAKDAYKMYAVVLWSERDRLSGCMQYQWRREVANALRLINEDKFQLIGDNDCSRLMELVEEYFCADDPIDAAISG